MVIAVILHSWTLLLQNGLEEIFFGSEGLWFTVVGQLTAMVLTGGSMENLSRRVHKLGYESRKSSCNDNQKSNEREIRATLPNIISVHVFGCT